MISADFYPTSTTAYGREYTAYLDDLSNSYDTLDDAFAPYIMGYTDPNNVPDWTYSTTFETVISSTAANSYVQFTDVRRLKNVPWFFMCRYATSLQNYTPALYRNNNNKWSKAFSSTTSYSFFNAANIANIGSNYPIVSIMFYDDDDATPTRLYSSANAELSPQFFDDASLSITIYQPSEQSINLSLSDFDELGWFTKTTNENHTIHGFISSVTTTPRRDVSSGGYNNYSNSCVCYYIEYDNPTIEHAAHIVSSTPYAKLGSSNNPYFTINTSNFSITGSKSESNMIVGGFVGKIPGTFIQTSAGNDIFVSDVNNFVAYNIGTGIQVYRIIKPSEIKKLFSIGTRYISTSVSGYRYGFASDVFVPLFNDDDSPKQELVSGSLSDIQSQLRPWQYGAITDNDFTIDDIPEYVPPSPEPGDDQGRNTGSVLRPTTLGVGGTNGFITQYSMTAAQIAEIGRLLWLSFTDPDYYKNFLFTLTTTGTLNISNLLDYFVSLRVYPFPLINVPSHTAAGQDMWIGAGLVPLSFNTNLHTINNYADYIDAGSCTIPRYYNDFRDFAHTQIMLYLPYCGTVQLNPADVVGSTLHAQYAVDFATGGVTAYVDCTTWDGSQFVIAVLTGSIGADIPLTASNAAQIAARIAGDALNFSGTVGEAISNDYGNTSQAITSAAVGDFAGAAIGVANTYAGRVGGAVDVARAGLQIASAEGVKMPMLSGGRGFGSFGAPQTAYVQIRRGIYAEGQQPPQGFKEAYGEAYSKPVQVSSCTGFTVFANVDTSGLQCDAMEREQVKKMMQAGIYI